MSEEITPFDPADYLKTEEDVIAYLNTWFEDGTPKEIARALGDVARSKGISETACFAALSSNDSPTLETLLAVLSALGLELTVQKRAA